MLRNVANEPIPPRNPILRAISGVYPYQIPAVLKVQSDEYAYLRAYFHAYLDDDFPSDWDRAKVIYQEIQKVADTGLFGRARLGKVLRRISPSLDTTKLYLTQPLQGEFYISIRYNDILRCSVTTHFQSCFSPNGCNSHRPVEKIFNPDTAICFVKDKSGKFSSRIFLSITTTGMFHVHGAYGELTKLAWKNLLRPVLNSRINYNKDQFIGYASTEYAERGLLHPDNIIFKEGDNDYYV
jgi:hypothetical protein